jgi:hypothetical protein
VRARAVEASPRAQAAIGHLLTGAKVDVGRASAAIARAWDEARVTVSFHPDRLLADGTSVADGLLRDGIYRSQFETGLSNGSRTAFPGGERDAWEAKLFGGAYHAVDVVATDRPRYGALDILHHADGGSPRFGSCYFVLRPEVRARCTFTWGDSHLEPEHVGMADVPAPVIAALLASAAELSTSALIHRLAALREQPRVLGRALDEYIEAQVHGPIRLSRDVAALVVDPSFDGTPTGEILETAATTWGFPLDRHPGFVLPVRDVRADFRGPRMPALAARVARLRGDSRSIDAVSIGGAAASLHREPDTWRDWASAEETLQHLKQLWHVLVRFGRPRSAGS